MSRLGKSSRDAGTGTCSTVPVILFASVSFPLSFSHHAFPPIFHLLVCFSDLFVFFTGIPVHRYLYVYNEPARTIRV